MGRKPKERGVPHSAEGRNNPRLQALREEFGIAAYAVYYMIMEVLAAADNLLDLDKEQLRDLSKDFGIEAKLLNTLFERFSMFPSPLLLRMPSGADTWIYTSPDLSAVNEEESKRLDRLRRASEKYRKKEPVQPEPVKEEPKPEPVQKKIVDVPAKEHALQIWIKKELANVRKMKTQLTYQDAESLVRDYDKKLIHDVLLAMENYALLTKRNMSVYYTAKNWAERRIKDGWKSSTAQPEPAERENRQYNREL